IPPPHAGPAAGLRAEASDEGRSLPLRRHAAGNLRRFFPNARIVCFDRPNHGPPMRAVDVRSEAVVIWRPEQGETVPKMAQDELERLKATPKGAAERIEVPWQPYPPTAKPQNWSWMIQMASPGG